MEGDPGREGEREGGLDTWWWDNAIHRLALTKNFFLLLLFQRLRLLRLLRVLPSTRLSSIPPFVFFHLRLIRTVSGKILGKTDFEEVEPRGKHPCIYFASSSLQKRMADRPGSLIGCIYITILYQYVCVFVMFVISRPKDKNMVGEDVCKGKIKKKLLNSGDIHRSTDIFEHLDAHLGSFVVIRNAL